MRRQATLAVARRPVDSFRCESRRDDGWTGPASTGDFVAAVERIIGLFGKQRFMRLSLLCFQIEGLPQAAAVTLVTRALRSQGIVGALSNGSVGFLYLGPRGKGMVADLALVHHIRQQVRDEVHRRSSFNSLHLVSMSVAHCWADEVVDAQDLVDALHQPRLESLQVG